MVRGRYGGRHAGARRAPDHRSRAPEPTPPAPARSGHPSALGYLAGLDGLRAGALLAVMAFHHGAPAARGGFLGVSTFFTLSGFLITSLAIDEWRRTGRLSWRRFWERRARRLLPAAVVTLCAVLALRSWGEIGSGARFRGDALGALAYVANWRQADAAGGYGAIFSAPSPVVHFWSLAIEEQFYVVFPLVFAGVAVVVGRRLGRGALVAGAAALASFGAAWVVRGPGGKRRDHLLRHPHPGGRAAGRRRPRLPARRGSARPSPGQVAGPSPATTRPGERTSRRRAVLAGVAGAAGLAGLAVLWSHVTVGDHRLFHGGTLLNAGLTVLVIWAVVRSDLLDRALGAPPLRAIGRISYGAYLVHWPLFMVLTADRTGVDGRALFAVRTAATLAAAAVSYVVVEAPFRFRLPMPRSRLAALAAGAAVAVAGLAVALPAPPAEYPDMATVSTGAPAVDPSETAAPGGPVDNARLVGAVTPEDGPPDAGTVLLAGDSVAWSLLAGVTTWNRIHADTTLQVDTHIAFGCPAGGAGTARVVVEQPTPADCGPWHADLGAAIDASSPDLVVMVMGLADLGGRAVDDEWRLPGDPAYDRWLLERLDTLATTMARRGVPVVWLTFPHIQLVDVGDPTRHWSDIPINEPGAGRPLQRAPAGDGRVAPGHHGRRLRGVGRHLAERLVRPARPRRGPLQLRRVRQGGRLAGPPTGRPAAILRACLASVPRPPSTPLRTPCGGAWPTSPTTCRGWPMRRRSASPATSARASARSSSARRGSDPCARSTSWRSQSGTSGARWACGTAGSSPARAGSCSAAAGAGGAAPG